MSTSTGPAYALKAHVNIMEVPDMLGEIRDAQSKAIMEDFIEDVIIAFDSQDEETEFADYLPKYITEKVSNQKDLSDRFTYLDGLLNAKVSFYFNKVRNEIYARLLNFSDESVKLFAELPIIAREVTYHNSSDSQLETITEAEWHDRRDLWNELDIKARDYPSVLSVPVFTKLLARYKILNAKNLLESLDTLKLPTYDYRYSRLFSEKYCNTLVKSGEDAMQVISHSMFFKHKSDGKSDFSSLYKSEENAGLIATTGVFVEERLIMRKFNN